MELEHQSELLAAKATELPAFASFNLMGARQALSHILSQVGRFGFFDEYTKHDMSHVDGALAVCDWLIPSETRKIMSPADWLLIVLAIYFHDVGMVLTRDEFAERESDAGFLSFMMEFQTDDGVDADYRAIVNGLDEAEKDRFLFQEYVRSQHAARSHQWINAAATQAAKGELTAVDELRTILRTLPPIFVEDLALVCGSHHLSDLEDLAKYRVVRPYGQSDAETANVQYAAIILRAADLLHISSDRAPAIEYRLINPKDPVSQQHWARQQKVTRVMPSRGRNKSSVIEVHATFDDENGYFGLTSYLEYASREITQCSEWASSAGDADDSKHSFPWQSVSSEKIEARGFEPKTYEFTFDQKNVLDLLTGHTLYNDAYVVIRELTQNAIDAARLQSIVVNLNETGEYVPKVKVTWDESKRTLSVLDNGTGITQEELERYLLTIGASKYQSDEFKQSYPTFSSISRFGIGILATFMVADDLVITTTTSSNDEVRRIVMRSVHGRYLVRKGDQSMAATAEIEEHGTKFTLRLRNSAILGNIENILKHWFVIPDVELTFATKGTTVAIGHQSAAEALAYEIGGEDDAPVGRIEEYDFSAKSSPIAVACRQIDNLDIAFAIRWNRWFKEWSLVSSITQRSRQQRLAHERPTAVGGICGEGVRINPSPPPRALARLGYWAW